MVCDPYPTTWSVLSDRKNGTYLLPACTSFEMDGSRTASNRSLQWGEKIVEPVFESKNDYDTMYMLARKLGFADRMFKNIKVENGAVSAEDILREINRGGWSTGYCGQSPERLKAHMKNQAKFDLVTLRAPKDDPEVGGDYYGLPWPCWGTPEFRHPGTPILYNTNLPVKDGGGTFRARFGVERVVKRKVMENGQEVEKEEHDNLLAEGSYSVGSEIKDGYPEFTLAVLKKLGWDKDLTAQEMAIIQRVNPANPDAVSWSLDLSGGIQRVAIEHGCSPYGNGKARMIAWNLPDPIPVHREPIYTPRPDLVANYPTLPDARQFRVPNIGFTVQKAAVDRGIAKQFPLILSSGRLVEYEGGGEETRSNKWLAELKQHMYVEINPADALERGIKDGGWVWVTGPESRSRTRSEGAGDGARRQGRGLDAVSFCRLVRGRRSARQVSERRRSDRARREREYADDLRLRSCDRHAGTEGDALPDQSGVRRRKPMARMKFLCDADRCIDCNACVTACKNENEVPWGINRRRVVTINDGKPGERSVSMACMHCTDAPCAAVCPVSCIYPTEDGIVLHSKDLCIGCGYCFYACPFGAPQYPKVGNFGSRGKMDKCTYCAGGGGDEAVRQRRGICEIRLEPVRRGQAAAMRRDVLDQVVARGRWRHHRADLQGARLETRLWLRRVGLDDGLSLRASRSERIALERWLQDWDAGLEVIIMTFLANISPRDHRRDAARHRRVRPGDRPEAWP